MGSVATAKNNSKDVSEVKQMDKKITEISAHQFETYPTGNYQDEIQKLIDSGKIKPGLTQIKVVHDSWCGIYRPETRCGCRCEIWDEVTGEKLN